MPVFKDFVINAISKGKRMRDHLKSADNITMMVSRLQKQGKKPRYGTTDTIIEAFKIKRSNRSFEEQ